MSLIDIQWNPSKRQLRQFAVICLVAIPLVGWLWGAGASLLPWLVLAGIGLALLGWTIPESVKPIYRVAMLLAVPIGLVVGELAMLLVYFGVFLPIGLLFKVLGRDALQRRLDPRADSYWQPKAQPPNVARYYRQS